MDVGKISSINIKQDIFSIQKNKVHNKSFIESTIYTKGYNGDTIDISDEVKALLVEDQDNGERSDEFKEMLENLKNASDPKNNPLNDFIKCVKIATRIIKGDHVPNKDILFLAKTEPKMYSSAILLRQQNDKPKRHDSLLKDEKKDVLKINNILEVSITNEDIKISIEIDA